MKVYLGEGANPSIGGMARVYEGLIKHLPCEIVHTIEEADVVNPHIGIWKDFPPDKPMVLSNHGFMWVENGWGVYGQKTNSTCVDALLQADVVTCPSHFVRKAIGRATLIDALVVHHGIDIDEWVPTEEPDNYVLWNKARLDPANDPSILNVLAPKLSHMQFLSTFGDEHQNLHIIGKQSPQNMYNYVQKAGVYLATAQESGGPCFGVLEAMACGVPVVSWNWGGTAEVITHQENGWLANSVDEMVEGIWYCNKHRKRLGVNARQTVIDHYQWKDTILGYVKAYEQALKQSDLKVSVIIPCYNLGEYVGRAIQSVLQQPGENWECIVVNDASTDNSAEIIDAFKDHPKVTVLTNSENCHVSESRNRAIRCARGKYILPLDADDALEPNALEALSHELDSDRSLHVVAGRLILNTGQEEWVNGWPNRSPDYEHYIKGENSIPYASMYRKRVWQNTGGYRRRIRTGIEDVDLWTRIFSYGYRGKLIQQPTLNYLNRAGSLGKSYNTKPDDWLRWYGWYHNSDIRPTEAIYSNDPPEISIIIPVGPGHLHHIQACLDSLVAQTYPLWEAIVINDSGKPFGHFKDGFPFVTFVENKGKGVAAARNTGLQLAKGLHVVFLDVDDLAQPDMLDELLYAHRKLDGWVYPDWYDQEGESGISQDWDEDKIQEKALSPITGMYYLHDLKAIGGFDEQAPGWEDWILHLDLVHSGVKGTRVPKPLFVYNKHLGERREDNFKKRKDLLQYIARRY